MGPLTGANIEQIDNIGKIKLMSLNNWCPNEGLVLFLYLKLAGLMVSSSLFVRAMKTFLF